MWPDYQTLVDKPARLCYGLREYLRGRDGAPSRDCSGSNSGGRIVPLRRRFVSRRVLALGLVLMGACAVQEAPPTAAKLANRALSDGALSQLLAAQQGRSVRGFEDAELRLELDLPGFGGIARDSAGRLVVYAPANRSVSDVEAAISASGLSMAVSAEVRAELGAGGFVLRHADYAFSQLVDWKDRLSAAVLLRNPKALSVDADELSNRLMITVSDPSAEGDILSVAATNGIPIQAVRFELGRKAQAASSLRDKFRPTGGGIQIARSSASGSILCTLGFNVRYGSPTVYGFITASHCAPGTLGSGTTGDTIYQNTVGGSNRLGLVMNNPAWNQTQGGCTVGGTTYTLCMAADAMFVQYDSAVSSSAQVASTASVGTSNGGGSISVNGWWTNVWQPTQTPYQGETVDKQGRTSGWTRGAVGSLCANTVLDYGVDVVVLCDNRVDGARAGKGDSGSPVLNEQASPPGSLYPYGVLHARSGSAYSNDDDQNCTSDCQYWFSGIDMIQGHLQQSYIWYQ